MRHQIKYKRTLASYQLPFFGSCLSAALCAGLLLGLSACGPQFKASVLSVENLIQDPELFAENTPESESNSNNTENDETPESTEETPEATELNPESAPESAPETAPETETSPETVHPQEILPPALPEVSEAPSDKQDTQKPEDSATAPAAPVAPSVENTEQTPAANEATDQAEQQEETIVVTRTETNGGAWFYLTQNFSVQEVQVDEQQNAVTVEQDQKVELAIEMINAKQTSKANNSVEASISADLGLDRLVELKTTFNRNTPRRTFKRGRWHIQAECQFHATENKCTMINYLVHVKFSFERKTSPPGPQVHLEKALAFYVSENQDSVFHYKILPASFRNFTELVTEMKAHANQGE